MDVRLLYVGYHEQSTQEYVETPRARRHVNVAFEDIVRGLRNGCTTLEPDGGAVYTEPCPPEFSSSWSSALSNNPPLDGDVDTRWAEADDGFGGESPNPVWPDYDV